MVDLKGVKIRSNEEIFKNIQSQMGYNLSDINMAVAQEEYEKRETYIHEIIDSLKQIQNNTANLASLVTLINKSNENQDELIEIIVELLSIAKEKDKKEVDSGFRRILNKISTFNGDIETVKSLMTFATSVMVILSNIT